MYKQEDKRQDLLIRLSVASFRFIDPFLSGKVSARNREITKRYLAGCSYTDISKEYEISRVRACQIVNTVIAGIEELNAGTSDTLRELKQRTAEMEIEIRKLRHIKKQLSDTPLVSKKMGILLSDCNLNPALLRTIQRHFNGVDTVQELSLVSKATLRSTPGIGRTHLRNLGLLLEKFGLRFQS